MEEIEATTESAKKVAELSKKYPHISNFDLMIAAICLSHDTPIITKDSDFQKIEELEVETIE